MINTRMDKVLIVMAALIVTANTVHAQSELAKFHAPSVFMNTYDIASIEKINEYNTVLEQACWDLDNAIIAAKGEGSFTFSGNTSTRVDAKATLDRSDEAYVCRYREDWVIYRDKAIKYYEEKHRVPTSTAEKMYGSPTGRRAFSTGAVKALEPFGDVVSMLKKEVEGVSITPLTMHFQFSYENNASQPITVSYD